jgi:hypothetical protein
LAHGFIINQGRAAGDAWYQGSFLQGQ